MALDGVSGELRHLTAFLRADSADHRSQNTAPKVDRKTKGQLETVSSFYHPFSLFFFNLLDKTLWLTKFNNL